MNSMVSRDSLFALAIVGVISYVVWGEDIREQVTKSAEGEGDSESHFLQDLIHKVKQKFNPSDLEQLQVERTGQTVDIIPLQYVESASYADHFAIDKAQTYVNTQPNRAGVTDFKIEARSPYNYNLAAEDFQFFNSLAPGQELTSSTVQQLASIQPVSEDPCCKPIPSYGLELDKKIKVPSVSSEEGSRLSLPQLQGQSLHDTLPPSQNDSYSSGSEIKSLAEWMTEGVTEVINDARVRFVPYMGGGETILRRV